MAPENPKLKAASCQWLEHCKAMVHLSGGADGHLAAFTVEILRPLDPTGR